jgi:hypothetical protein
MKEWIPAAPGVNFRSRLQSYHLSLFVYFIFKFKIAYLVRFYHDDEMMPCAPFYIELFLEFFSQCHHLSTTLNIHNLKVKALLRVAQN